MTSQPCILASVPAHARSLTFEVRAHADPRPGLARLLPLVGPDTTVIGLGEPLARALGKEVPGLRVFPSLVLSRTAAAIPSTQGALWVLLHGADRGETADRADAVIAALGTHFLVSDAVDAFKYREGRDLTGYLDGTENPAGDKARAAAIATDGGSFVAVQRWVHDLPHFAALASKERDHTIGRSLEGNEEIADAPPTAHVKRAAQESFEPEALLVRRSMPWMSDHAKGILFLAYGESLDRYERILRRMVGLEDGIVDALFGFSRPMTGGYYYCPRLTGGRVDASFFA